MFRIKEDSFNFYIGLITILISIVFLFVVYRGTAHDDYSDNSYKVSASFTNSYGIIPGAPVMISGIQIGEVKSKQLNKQDYSSEVHINLHSDVELSIDTVASISTEIMGVPYINLKPGKSKELLKDGDELIYTKSAMTISDIIAKFVDSYSESNSGKNSQMPNSMGSKDNY